MKETELSSASWAHANRLFYLVGKIPTDTEKIWEDNLRPFSNSFKDGARWLLGKPLGERLRDEEKEKFLNLYQWAKECNSENEEAAVTISVLESIFTKEFFEKK